MLTLILDLRRVHTLCLLLCFTVFLFENFITLLCTDDVAMSIEEENEISTLLTASINLNSKSDEISPEDATWVDSFLVFNYQMSDDS